MCIAICHLSYRIAHIANEQFYSSLARLHNNSLWCLVQVYNKFVQLHSGLVWLLACCRWVYYYYIDNNTINVLFADAMLIKPENCAKHWKCRSRVSLECAKTIPLHTFQFQRHHRSPTHCTISDRHCKSYICNVRIESTRKWDESMKKPQYAWMNTSRTEERKKRKIVSMCNKMSALKNREIASLMHFCLHLFTYMKRIACLWAFHSTLDCLFLVCLVRFEVSCVVFLCL